MEAITVKYTDIEAIDIIFDNTESIVVKYTDVEAITVIVDWE